MASNKSAILDLGMDSYGDTQSQLEFQDFIPSEPSSSVRNMDFGEKSSARQDRGKYTSFAGSLGDDDGDVEDKLLGEESSTTGKTSASPFSFEYYQQFFDVDTHQVLRRILWSSLPCPGKTGIHANPDLYGPFWVCVTLVFTIAVTGNVANYLQTAASGSYVWRYDFHKVSMASFAIFSYAWLVPLVLWAALWWHRSSSEGVAPQLSLLELLCVYGYSLSIYIPICILWVVVINWAWIQWLLVVAGAAMSGFVLFTVVWPAVSKDQRKVGFVVIAGLLLVHFVLAVGFMKYFFHAPSRGLHIAPALPTAEKVAPLEQATFKLPEVKEEPAVERSARTSETDAKGSIILSNIAKDTKKDPQEKSPAKESDILSVKSTSGGKAAVP